jgi:hypothetical protein
VFPKTDGCDLSAIWDCQGNQTSEAFLRSQPGKDFILYKIGKFRKGIRFQTYSNLADKHGPPPSALAATFLHHTLYTDMVQINPPTLRSRRPSFGEIGVDATKTR